MAGTAAAVSLSQSWVFSSSAPLACLEALSSIPSPPGWMSSLQRHLSSAPSPPVSSLLSVLFSRPTLALCWCLWTPTRSWRSTPSRTWSGTAASASTRSLLTCECCHCSLVTPTHGTRQKRQTGLCPVPAGSPGDREDPLRVWCEALSIPVPLSKEDELPLQEQYLERELVPSWLQEQLLTQPWQDRSSLFQGYLGSLCPGLSRGKSFCCVGVSFLPLLLLPDQYLSGISLVAKIPSACWNKECIYLHGLAWWAFPISHLKKNSLRSKVIFESVWIFCQTERKRWLRAEATWLQNGFSSGLKAKFWAPLGGFFMLCFVGFFF